MRGFKEMDFAMWHWPADLPGHKPVSREERMRLVRALYEFLMQWK